MDYSKLLDLTTKLGYELAMSGAETFRIEESVTRIFRAYDIDAEVFVIPNCMHISIEPVDGTPLTRMRRIGNHGNDLDAVERFSGLSRRICGEKPAPEVALQWLEETKKSRRYYKMPMYLAGNFLGSFGFALLFGGTFADGLCSGVCGLIVGLITLWMEKMGANSFFRIIAAAFAMSLFAYTGVAFDFADSAGCVIIGALMLLVPGLLFTNAMRDIIFGDTNSGMNRIVQVLLIAVAIALGTAAAWNVSALIYGAPIEPPVLSYSLPVQCLVCAIACVGFAILFNIHGPGGLLCALGGVLAWVVYVVVLEQTGSDINAYFWAALVGAAYSEVMARIRKYPAISYLVIAIFPLIPGAGVYYSMRYAVQGQMSRFAAQGMHTAAIAGVIAVGILLVSTTVRLMSSRIRMKRRT